MKILNYINEIWKPVRGYERFYEVSNFGRVKALHWHQSNKERLLRLHKHYRGYIETYLSKNRVRRVFKVHRLVWEAFNGPIPEGMQINHINECVWDNRLENLNLMTPKENSNWGSRKERIKKKMINRSDKSKPIQQYTLNMKFVAEYPSQQEAARQTGVNQRSISCCCLGKHKFAGTKDGPKFIWKYKSEAS